MGSVYRTAEGNLVLYDQDGKIYVRTLIRESIGRATVLASDYGSDLSDVLYRGTVFYAYKTVDGDILIRNITENGVWYRLGETGGPEGHHPKLAVIDGDLFLWYVVQNPVDGLWGLRCEIPDVAEEKKSVLQKWKGKMAMDAKSMGTEMTIPQVIPCQEGIMVMADHERMFWWGPKEGWISISRERSEKEMQEKTKNLEREKHIKEQHEKELAQKDLLIESIKKQYEELMQVAQTYREEAIKWRSKFL